MLMIIDGNNIAMRAFHTPMGNLTTKSGEPTGSMLGLINSLKNYLDKFPETERVIIAWDGGRSKWRKALYPDYKANRSYNDTPEEEEKYNGLWKQLNILHEFLPTLGIHSIKLNDTEADDVIAGVCKIYPKEPKIVVTADKDMLQLIDENTVVFSPYKGKVISELNFYEETGVTKEAYMGYRALVGDSSDNILGIPGIGDKTAKNLMDKYGHIDNILNPTPDIKKAIIKSKRTAKIYEPANLRILGRNNKIMNFDYINLEDFKEDIINNLSQELITNSTGVRDFLIKWEFVSILSNFTPFILTFRALNGLVN